LPAASDALATVGRLDPAHPLTAIELTDRARVLADAGRVDDAIRALEQSNTAPQANKVTPLFRLRAKGMALYHARGRGLDAAKVLSECVAAGGPNAAQDAFYAARALSRADHDDDAIAGYESIIHAHPKTHWADEASYFVPYLKMLHGEWKEAARGFDAYAKKFPDGAEKKDAARFGALCHLLDRDFKTARRRYEHMVEDEPESIASARLADLAALAANGDGDRTHAVARWTDIARSRPLSWGALVARARLAEAGAPVPPPIDPPESATMPADAPLSVVIPPPVDLLHGVGLDADAESALRDREPLLTSGAGGRSAEALCAAYGTLGRGRRRFQVAQTLAVPLFAMSPSTRTRWAWECAFPMPYAGHVRAAEEKEGLPPGLVYAVMRQESGYDPNAVSPAHAVGLMQLLPETAKTLADEMGLSHDDARLTSPPYNIALGAHYLKQLVDKFHGQLPLAIAAYNCGPESVARWTSRSPGMEIDTFVERIPFKETRDYVSRVMGNFARYGWLAKGDEGVPTLALAIEK
jgi:soluble lytic murein transglycosylase